MRIIPAARRDATLVSPNSWRHSMSSTRPSVCTIPGRRALHAAKVEPTPCKPRATTRCGGQTYDRERELPRLVALWPSEIRDLSLVGRRRLLQLLRAALRAERTRGIAGHWTYDLARHSQLLRAYRIEAEALERARLDNEIPRA